MRVFVLAMAMSLLASVSAAAAQTAGPTVPGPSKGSEISRSAAKKAAASKKHTVRRAARPHQRKKAHVAQRTVRRAPGTQAGAVVSRA